MGVWRAPEDRVEDYGFQMASFAAVSHCYQRPIYPDWPYNIFTMVHGHTPEECERVLGAIAEDTGLTEYVSLYSTREYKKTRVEYFTDDYADWERKFLGEVKINLEGIPVPEPSRPPLAEPGRRGRATLGARMVRSALRALVIVCVLLASHGAPSARAQAGACPAGGMAGAPRYVVLIHRFGSSSLTGAAPDALDPANQQVRDDFGALRDLLAANLAPAPRFVYFSYGVARELAQGGDPTRAWEGSSPDDEHAPVYWASDTTDYSIADQAAALGWLVRELRRCAPDAMIDVVGYRTGESSRSPGPRRRRTRPTARSR